MSISTRTYDPNALSVFTNFFSVPTRPTSSYYSILSENYTGFSTTIRRSHSSQRGSFPVAVQLYCITTV